MEKIKFALTTSLLLTFQTLSLAVPARAQGPIAALDTNGIVYQVDTKTGALTEKTEEAFTDFSLGGTVRRGGKFYYVVAPAGLSENALYTSILKSGTLIHVDLDRDDDVRALFLKGNKLYGIFYDGNAGSAGLYRIAPTTGVTTLILDLSDLNVEPIAGAITQIENTFYMLVKPEANSAQRQLLRFKVKSGSAQLFDVVDGTGNPVLCDKLKINAAQKAFVCLAQAAAETQVNVCRVSLKGKTTCVATLTDILRVGSGHTMLSNNGKTFYAFVYAPGEPDNQRLIKFNAKGVIKSNLSISTIMIGAHFQ